MAIMTLEKVKERGEIEDSRFDQRIRDLMVEVQDDAEEYLQRKLDCATYTEYHDTVEGQRAIWVRNPPWHSISSLTHNESINPVTIDYATNVKSEQEYKDRGEVRLFNGEGTYYAGEASVKIIYDGGYDDDVLPRGLQGALLDEVLFRLEHRHRIGIKRAVGIVSTFEYDEQSGFAKHNLVTLARYRQWHRVIG